MKEFLFTPAGRIYLEHNYVELERSSYSIAKEFETYANYVIRALHAHGMTARTKAEAQEKALKSGRHAHPTKGSPRTESTREAIGEAVSKSWDKTREGRVEAAKERWRAMPAPVKERLRSLAASGVRKAASGGSKLEHALAGHLEALGHEVRKRVKVADVKTDLFLPGLNTVIRVDGPAHLLPIYGEARLARVVALDHDENLRLQTAGFVVLKVRWFGRTISALRMKKVLQQLESMIDSIKAGASNSIDLEIS